MKISIGLRLFASVLLAILAVAASAVFLLRQDVLERFGDYAAQVELDRLEELSATLARRYARSGSWDFIPAAHKRAWLADELARRNRNARCGSWRRPHRLHRLHHRRHRRHRRRARRCPWRRLARPCR
ncbi:hypothetical protein [Massilia sp. Se16.2.3]|uniref:hypothetical protein n=1 Tax=Massilia sp. Se16.2.3 TaxID=2709303 RepID=UPI00160086FD|nr:hypothetical protein [Massilia sp. Se16.2.3]QNB00718.1 hypothetical protein G4G31_21030 [Massilia sp. Se16.2.3]